jgi:hypothetical protein
MRTAPPLDDTIPWQMSCIILIRMARHDPSVQVLDEVVFQRLRAEVSRTAEEFAKARRHFLLVIAEIPSRIPHPDGAHRIENAGAVQSAAMVAYTKALRNFSDFLLSGKIPRGLEP